MSEVKRRDPLLVDVPVAMETARLALRVLQPGEGAMVHGAIQESIAELRPWMPWAQRPSVEASETFVRQSLASFHQRTDLSWGMFSRADGVYVGNVGLHNIRWPIPSFEVGYWCRTSAAGQGLVTEAVRALTLLCIRELGAARVEIRMDPLNERSWRVAERLGFLREGELRASALGVDGAPRDTRIYARTSDAGL